MASSLTGLLIPLHSHEHWGLAVLSPSSHVLWLCDSLKKHNTFGDVAACHIIKWWKAFTGDNAKWQVRTSTA